MLIGTFRANTIRKNKVLLQVKSFLNRKMPHHWLSLSKGVGFSCASLEEYRHMCGLLDSAENKLKGDCLISWEESEWKSLVSLLLSTPYRDRPQSYPIERSLLTFPVFYAPFGRAITQYRNRNAANCEIKAVGMKFLVRAELKGLRKLAVGTPRAIEGSIGSAKKGPPICLLRTGRTFSSWASVIQCRARWLPHPTFRLQETAEG